MSPAIIAWPPGRRSTSTSPAGVEERAIPHAGRVLGLAITSGGKIAATGSWDRRIRFTDLVSGEARGEVRAAEKHLHALKKGLFVVDLDSSSGLKTKPTSIFTLT
jgi:hypothetical protein